MLPISFAVEAWSWPSVEAAGMLKTLFPYSLSTLVFSLELHDCTSTMGLLRFFGIVKSSTSSKDVTVSIFCQDSEKSSSSLSSVTARQRVLLLRGPKQPYVEVFDHPTPTLDGNRELLVRNIAIGLNPIDWKAP